MHQAVSYLSFSINFNMHEALCKTTENPVFISQAKLNALKSDIATSFPGAVLALDPFLMS